MKVSKQTFELVKLALIVGHTLGDNHRISVGLKGIGFPLNTDALQDQTTHAFLNTEGLFDLSDTQIASHIMATVDYFGDLPFPK